MNNIWTIGSTLDWTTKYFTAGKIPDPRLDAEILLSTVMRCKRLNLMLDKDTVIPGEKLSEYRELIRDRRKRKPLQYITGEQEFMGLSFSVNENTLIPRPETEMLVEEAIRVADEGNKDILFDMCTGSGNIAVSIAKLSDVKVIYGIDISLEALKIAQNNINKHGMAGRIILKKGDLFKAVENECIAAVVDIIVSNPPYVAQDEFQSLEPELSFEPRLALDGGRSGLVFYERIALDCRKYLKNNGYVILELNANKVEEIRRIFECNNFKTVRTIKDYNGCERILTAQIKS